MTLRGSQTEKITVVTGYRVFNTIPSSAGVTTAFMQQYRGLSNKLHSNNNPLTPQLHRQFILDLPAWLEHLIAEGYQLILSMDSHENLSSMGSFTPLSYNPDIETSCSQHNGK
jgi:hypothetical protein